MPDRGTTTMPKIRMAPSILSADFAALAEDIAKVEPYAEIIHLDVMDGHFVPNITFGPPLVKSVRKVTDKFLDAHLMIEEPQKYIERFAEAGADNITVHIEISDRPEKLIEQIRKTGKQAGITLNPGTPVESIERVLDLVDMVLVMTVQPGFGGQEFREECLPKMEWIRQRCPELPIEVDGGINELTIPRAVRAGADTIVTGSAVFGAGDPAREVLKLKRLAEEAHAAH